MLIPRNDNCVPVTSQQNLKFFHYFHLMKYLPSCFLKEKLLALLFSLCYFFRIFCLFLVRQLLDIMQTLINFFDVTETVLCFYFVLSPTHPHGSILEATSSHVHEETS